jgi:hypothetical protein
MHPAVFVIGGIVAIGTLYISLKKANMTNADEN